MSKGEQRDRRKRYDAINILWWYKSHDPKHPDHDMSPSQRPLSLECFRVDEIIDIGVGVITFFLRRGVLAVVCLKESKGTPLAASPTQFVDGAVDFVVASRFEALAAPSIRLASTWPKAVFRPMVGGCASPAVAILLWAIKREMIVRIAPKANLSPFVLLRLLLLGLFRFLLLRRLLLRPPLLLGRGRGMTFGLVLQLR